MAGGATSALQVDVSGCRSWELVSAVTNVPSVFRVPHTDACRVSAFEVEDWVLALRPRSDCALRSGCFIVILSLLPGAWDPPR